jgi:hypothetical protein
VSQRSIKRAFTTNRKEAFTIALALLGGGIGNVTAAVDLPPISAALFD